MFNLKEAERIARDANPAFDAACERVDKEEELYFEPVDGFFGRLEEEVATMDIASRFRRDITPNHDLAMSKCHPLLEGLSEVDYKRQQLLHDVRMLRAAHLSIVRQIKDLVMDIEATRTEN